MEVAVAFLAGVLITSATGFFLYKVLSKVQETQFKQLAQDIFESNAQNFQTTTHHNVNSIVNPLKENIKDFKQQLDQMHKFDIQDRENFRTKMNQMISSASKIETEAGLLTQALTSDVKFQGDWGEIVLENILELSGLENGRDYQTQITLKDKSQNSFRPDAIVNLPNQSHIIIDSKVSLKAYFDYINSEDKETALRNLKNSIQSHIDQLAKKNYHNLDSVKSPEFVYLFIPVEGVYSLLLKEYPNLIDESLKKNIILVSPVNLIANLKTVASLWRVEKQSKNAEVLAQKAGAMHDKFIMIVDDLHKLEGAIQKVAHLNENLITKVSTGKGNLISRANELKELGAKTTKSLQ